MADYDYTQDVDIEQENNNERKRKHEGGDHGRDGKRSSRGRDKPTLKLLLPSFAIGKLIGKGGKNIGDLESKHNANIEVAPAKDFYPGTDDRCVALSADIEEIQSLVTYMIMDVHEDSRDKGEGQDTVMAVTNTAVGFVMGRGGSNVKEIQTESRAQIKIQKQNESLLPDERLIIISGNREQKRKAAEMIVEKLSGAPMRMSDPRTKYDPYASKHNSNDRGGSRGGGDHRGDRGDRGDRGGRDGDRRGGFNLSSSLRNDPYAPDPMRYMQDEPAARYNSIYGDGGAGALGGLAAAAAAAAAVNNFDGSATYESQSRAKSKTAWKVTMEIPNGMVGSIVGKGGSAINEITRASHAQISFSGKDEFAPGTQDRFLTIEGDKKQVQKAHMLIDQKIMEVERSAPPGGY